MKTVTIPHHGGKRHVELRDPGEEQRTQQMAMTPEPLQLDFTSFVWLQETIIMGTELNRQQANSLEFASGMELLSEVIDLWVELTKNDNPELQSGDSSSDNGPFAGLDLDDQGAVEIEEMR